MNWVDKLFDFLVVFFRDARRPKWSKLGIFLGGFVILYIFNEKTGLLFYYSNNKKLEIIKQIAEIRKSSAVLTEEELNYVSSIKLSTIQKQDKVEIIAHDIGWFFVGIVKFPIVMIESAFFEDSRSAYIKYVNPRTHFILANLFLFVVLCLNFGRGLESKGSVFVKIIVILITEYLTLIGMVICYYLFGIFDMIFQEYTWVTISLDVLSNIVLGYMLLKSWVPYPYNGAPAEKTKIIEAVIRDKEDRRVISKLYKIQVREIIQLENEFWKGASAVFGSREDKEKLLNDIESLYSQIGLLKAEKEALRKKVVL